MLQRLLDANELFETTGVNAHGNEGLCSSSITVYKSFRNFLVAEAHDFCNQSLMELNYFASLTVRSDNQ